ncbi:very short patch repair endonuclease [Thiohalophilus sp.]|uniref:very short patch repair endonuclease n=1 Tax=Thiohalophilus sp. TaxID=3028392 RepID=UPI003A0FB8FC
MVDTRSKEQRSRIMSSVHDKNTRPEMYVRSMLHRMGYRFRLHRKGLPGRPDIVFPSRHKVIFVNGCFWHSHNCKYDKPPKSKLDYWLPKLEATKKRDKKNVDALKKLGWEVLTVWQCELRNPSFLQQRLKRFLKD